MIVSRRFNRRFSFDPTLALWLPLYQLDGASFKSADKNGFTCAVTGATWGIQGRSFDATGTNAISLGAVLDATANGTIIVWAKPTALPANQYFYSKGGVYMGLGIGAASKAKFLIYDGTTYALTSTNNVTAGVFSMYAGTWGAAGMVIYVNGVADGTNANTGTFTGNGEVAKICGADGVIACTVGEVIYYTRALSAGEIASLYQATRARYL